MESRQRGEEMQCVMERQWENGPGWSHIHVWWIKIGRDTVQVSDPSPRPDCTAQGFSTRKINLHNFCL